MTVRFLHAADVHLGYEQYGSAERAADYMTAFERLATAAIERRVDFVLLAGDLFQKRTVDPRTLYGATQVLVRLRNAGIRVLAIEGNHERPPSADEISWLAFFNNMHLLALLDVPFRDGRPHVSAWTDSSESGSYMDLDGDVRVVGVKYHGASTARVVADLVPHLAELRQRSPRYTILMLHAGLQGVLDNYSATLSRADLNTLRPHVDYIALGHIHKPFMQDDWLYNPGSLEANSVAEVAWSDRGYLDVTVTPGGALPHRAVRVPMPGRPFVLLAFATGEWRAPEELYAQLEAYLARESAVHPAAAPVVELRLTGSLPFDHTDLDLKRVEDMARAAFAPVVLNLRDETVPREFDVSPAAPDLPRVDLERLVLEELAGRDARRAPLAERWAELALNIKRLALARSDGDLIVGELQRFCAEVDSAC